MTIRDDVKQLHSGFSKISELPEDHNLYVSSKHFISCKLQDWNETLVSKALVHLSKEIINPQCTLKIMLFFPQYILDVVTSALNSGVDYLRKCIMLKIVFLHQPDVFLSCTSFFNNKKPPWAVDCIAPDQCKRRKIDKDYLTDLDIVEICWNFLKANLLYFQMKWDWSEFIKKYIPHSNKQVLWVACQCTALVLHMNEKTKIELIEKYLSDKMNREFSICYGLKSQRIISLSGDVKTKDYDVKSSLLTAKMMPSTFVKVAGVSLPIFNTKNRIKEGCLVETPSAVSNLRRIAIGVTTGKAVCIIGPVGSGKTASVEHLAIVTGRQLSRDVLKVQLGEETDAKLLLGTYKCTDLPGEFIWVPGVLTKAILEGRWLVLEDIESASSDVSAVLSCLLEENYISIPGFRDNVRPADGFQLFMTHRLVSGVHGYHRKQTSATELLEKHWLQVHLEQLTKEELTQIIQTKFHVLETIAFKMVASYLLFSKGKHEEDMDTPRIQTGTRLISTRDLMKWCARSATGFNVSSHESALKVFKDAVDIFCCSYNDPEVRLKLAIQVAGCLGIIENEAHYYCSSYKPTVNVTSSVCTAGRASLRRIVKAVPKSGYLSFNQEFKFALTRTSCCLLERVAVCLSLDEPILLVGETGTGKTTTLQLLAKQTGHRLVVINMNQQSDSSDLLGGYKPVDVKQLIVPLREEFEELFRSLFVVKSNMDFLDNISQCVANRKWITLLKLMIHCQLSAEKRLTEKTNKEQELSKWRTLGEKLKKILLQIRNNEVTLAFSFIEGSLVQALREGCWVLLDEINLASAETLQCLSGLLEGSKGSLSLLERGDDSTVPRHTDFRIMAAMNPATDYGKKDLPSGIRNRFTELFVAEHSDKDSLVAVVSCYLPDLPAPKVDSVVYFYLAVRKSAIDSLCDGSGNRPHYSLRTLCRALVVASENKCGSMQRSLYEALCLSFLTQLNAMSHDVVKNMIARTVLEKNDVKSILGQPIPEPKPKEKYIPFEGYWVPKGELKPHVPEKYLLTSTVRRNLCDIARCVSLSNHPVLIQGETSVGKTSLILYLAQASGHNCLRINNHQHTDLQEYVGSYSADATGSLVFNEGVLVQAMRNGHWIILDELNLAPSEVLEALNRVLDDNRELFIPETNVTVKAHPNFRLFATQNPPGTYGGRKMLSRAFRNRFVELHFDEIPSSELEQILQHRCHMPLSYSKKLVAVMSDLQVRRKGSAAFSGKQGFITLRDLFRWGERYRLATQGGTNTRYYDWDQHIADEGYLVLAGRVRKEEECQIIQEVIEKKIKRKIELDKLFTLSSETSPVTRHVLEKVVQPPLPSQFSHIVWTYNIRKLAVLVGKALEFHEPVLLVGETGCGKTTVCQLLAAINHQSLYSVSCHLHSESSDFLGGLRPVREKIDNSNKLFEWVNGPLIEAMMGGHIFLADEISLADYSVLERLNSLLEPERKLLVSEKGTESDIEITAGENFHFIGTMNPGGDFGKKELSPALRNRLTEIWCEGPTTDEDLTVIANHNLKKDTSLGQKNVGSSIVQFIRWFSSSDIGNRVSISVRDILTWVRFINVVTQGDHNVDVSSAYVHGACLTFLDGVGAATTSSENVAALNKFKMSCVEFLLQQLDSALGKHPPSLDILSSPGLPQLSVVNTKEIIGVDPFFIKKEIWRKSTKTSRSNDFMFDAPTTRLNALRLLRALQIPSKAVLLEGSPGVGKTSIVLALAAATRNKITRINLSEQTDVSDLFGADLPVEGAAGGHFSWKDGPFLKALKDGHWILLDELNLASQSVVEGLNSVLDHRGEIFIPELGKTFTVQVGKTRLFACQNPQRQGGARKGLPRSFINRFTQVFVEPLLIEDLEVIMSKLYPNISQDLSARMVQLTWRLSQENWTSGKGGPWEFNLRDLTRWAESLQLEGGPGSFFGTVYRARMRTHKDKQRVNELYEEIFLPEYPLCSEEPPLLVNPSQVILGEVVLDRFPDFFTYTDSQRTVLALRGQRSILRSLALCVRMGWMAILVGSSHCGKTSVLSTLAQLVGKRLYTLPVSTTMDTMELLGGFEQTDYGRHLETLRRKAETRVMSRVQSLVSKGRTEEAEQLYTIWHRSSTPQHDEEEKSYSLKSAEERLLDQLELLKSVCSQLPDSEQFLSIIAELDTVIRQKGIQAGGAFEWVDSILLKCLEEGGWLVVDNVNLCSGAVLDRLNSLLETHGSLALGERGRADDVIRPNPDFRIFLTMDPKHGDISRAMRNRGVEIFMDSPDVSTAHPFDLDSILYHSGIQLFGHRAALINIHRRIVEKNQSPDQPSVHHLFEVAFIAYQNWRRGSSLFESVSNAFTELYINSRALTPEQKHSLSFILHETLTEHQSVLTNNEFTIMDTFRPELKTPSTLALQENSRLSIAQQHCSIVYAILRHVERLSKSCENWPTQILLKDIVGYDLTFLHLEHYNPDYSVHNLIIFLITTCFNISPSSDISLRREWLENTLNEFRKNASSDSPLLNNILNVSRTISDTLSTFVQDAGCPLERPWDMRHYVSSGPSFAQEDSWSRQNQMLALVYYNLVKQTSNDGADVFSPQFVNKPWNNMTVLEYSQAISKGQVPGLPIEDLLVLHLYDLLTCFDELMSSLLQEPDVLLTSPDCAKLMCTAARRFRLSSVASRQLFNTVEHGSNKTATVCKDLISLLELHYRWFKKYTISFIFKLASVPQIVKKRANLEEFLNKIDQCSALHRLYLIRLSKKILALMERPAPLSTPRQFHLMDKMQRLEGRISMWNQSTNSIVEDIRFIAKAGGQRSRRILIQSAVLLHENKQLDAVETFLEEFEAILETRNSSDGSPTPKCSVDEVSQIKLWPLQELICLQLNSAVRVALSQDEDRSHHPTLSGYAADSLVGWLESTSSVSPVTSATIQAILNQYKVDRNKSNNMELTLALFKQTSSSLALQCPFVCLGWDDKVDQTENEDKMQENQALFAVHFPLFSLYLTSLLPNTLRPADTPSLALKEHKNTSRLYQLIKLTFWRNLPALFSNSLDICENEIRCLENTFKSLLTTLSSALLTYNNLDNSEEIELEENMLSRVITLLTLIEKANRQNTNTKSVANVNKIIYSIIDNLSLLKGLVDEVTSLTDETNRWLAVGRGWALYGHTMVLLCSQLESVDPVIKRAIKVKDAQIECTELKNLLCAEELNRVLLGADLSWPMKAEYETRIKELEEKTTILEKSVAVRPPLPLYNDIIQDIFHLSRVLLSDENFKALLSKLCNTSIVKMEKEKILAEAKSWLISLNRFQERLYSKYYTSYPDIVNPPLIGMHQMSYGMKLVWTATFKKMLRDENRSNFETEEVLTSLCIFPIPDLTTCLKVMSICSSSEIINLLNKSYQLTGKCPQQDHKIRLIKICIRLVKSVSQTLYKMTEAKNVLFKILEHVVLCWQRIEEEEKLKKAQEDSIYINRMKLTEEEEMRKEMIELFPSTREEDFGDMEAPDTLDYEPPEIQSKKEDPLRLSKVDIDEICQLHAKIVAEQARCHWLPRRVPAPDQPVALLQERVAMFSGLLEAHYGACQAGLDRESVSGLLLLACMPSRDSPLREGRLYDFYRDPNIAESRLCIPILNAILQRVRELLVEWPDHPTLHQITTIVDRVCGFSLESPLSRFLTGLELLLTKLYHWEENAHVGVSLGPHSATLTVQIIAWRKLELAAWKGALHSTFLRVQSDAKKWWFHLFSLLTSYVRSEEDTEEGQLLRADVVKSLEAFMETSPIGEYFTRLQLLYTFHCHALLLGPSKNNVEIANILWNLYNFYKLFEEPVGKVINELTGPVEKKIKDFVKIARWNDISYWAIKSAIEKTHHTLLKHIKEYEKILKEPAKGAMLKIDLPQSVLKMKLSTAHAANYITSCNLPESYLGLESNESLLTRLGLLLKKSRNISKQTVEQCSYPKLSGNLDLLIEDINETGKLILEFDIDPTVPQEKRKSLAKSLLQRKRKAISDLFRTLTQIGLSYRSGLLMYEQKNIEFCSQPPLNVAAGLEQIDRRKCDKDWLNSCRGVDMLFYTSVARLATLKIVLEKPHKDMGPQVVERVKGFTSHSNKLLSDMKKLLSDSSKSLYLIRCQTAQLMRLEENKYGFISSDFYTHKANLKETLNDIVYCLQQFKHIFDACPEQELQLLESDLVPMIFPDDSKNGMVTALKFDPIWESTKAKVDSVIKTVVKLQNQLSESDKHLNFAEQILGSEFNGIDIIINEKHAKLLVDGYIILNQINHQIGDIQMNFQQKVDNKTLDNPLVSSLAHLSSIINDRLSKFGNIQFPYDITSESSLVFSDIPVEFSQKMEKLINKSLVIIQNLYKSHVQQNDDSVEKSEESNVKPDEAAIEKGEQTVGKDEEEKEELILDGHLKEKIVENLLNDIKSLRIDEVFTDLKDICKTLTDMENVNLRQFCQRLMYHCHPILDQLISLYNFFMVQLSGAVKILGKLSVTLLSVLVEFGKNGYNVPDDLREELEGEGESMKGGVGLGEGEGEKDVSDQIESQDQLEDARKPGEYGNDEEKDCKEEEKGVEMSDDFGGKLQDIEKNEDEGEDKSDKEDDDEPDKEMGETEKGADTLDQQIWGSDSEEENDEDEEMPKDEQGDRGAEQSEKQMGAKEEDKEAVVDDKERSEDRRKEQKEQEINEMEEAEVDDDQIDPYHGNQPPTPEIEPLDLGDDDMDVQNDDLEASQDEDEENPFDIDSRKEEMPETEPPESEEKEEETKQTEEEKKGDDGDDRPDLEHKKPEAEEEEEKDKASEDIQEGELEEEAKDEEAGHEEASGVDDKKADQETESSEMKHGSRDQVKNKDETEVDMSTTPEETSAEGKEESGAGTAENVDVNTGGHKGQSGKRKTMGEKEQEERKHKPGQSELQRSLAEVEEPVKKRLKTIGVQDDGNEEEKGEEMEKIEEDTEADLYQHIKEAKDSKGDAKTMDAATQEQAEKQPIIGKEDEEEEDPEQNENEEIMDMDEDEIQIDNKAAEEKLDKTIGKDEKESGKPKKGEGGDTLEEATVEVEGEYVPTLGAERAPESSYHTRTEELETVILSESELAAMRMGLEEKMASWSQMPATEEAAAAWEKLSCMTNPLARDLSEQLRLVLEPTSASALRGDFRTGRRINMRKVIPYIASQFRKDKIWLRRSKPLKREYQIILAIDNSSSMSDNHSKELAFESLALVSKALTLLEAGDLAVLSFGESIRVLHELGHPFTEHSGARLVQEFTFEERRTRVGAAIQTALRMLTGRGVSALAAQLLVIVSDGRNAMAEGEATVRAAVRAAAATHLFIVFIVIDNPGTKDSILDIRMPTFKNGKLEKITSYMDNFPFPFYVILRDINNLPSVLSDALRQWFELVTNLQ